MHATQGSRGLRQRIRESRRIEDRRFRGQQFVAGNIETPKPRVAARLRVENRSVAVHGSTLKNGDTMSPSKAIAFP